MFSVLELENSQLKDRIVQLESNLAATEHRVLKECNKSKRFCELYAKAQERVQKLEREIVELKLCMAGMKDGPKELTLSDLSHSSPTAEAAISMNEQNDTAQVVRAISAYVEESPGSCDVKGEAISEFDAADECENAVSKADTSQPAAVLFPSYSCDVCGESYMKESFFIKHLQSCHKQLFVTSFQCPLCCKYYANVTVLNDHIDIVHNRASRHPCALCGKSFSRRDGLVVHIREQHEGVKYECMFCHKQFARKGRLNTHVKTHAGIYPHTCDICGKGFIERMNLLDHRNQHPEIATFVSP